MEFTFNKDGILYGTNNVKYEVFETEKANTELIKMLQVCIKDERDKKDNKFTCTEDCTPFGKLIKETLENEFNLKIGEEIYRY